MKPEIFTYFIRGIFGDAERRDWTDEAEWWWVKLTQFPADNYKYFSRVLANVFAGGRTRLIKRDISEWCEITSHVVVPVMHSHGSKLGLGALAMIDGYQFPEVVLIAAAVNRDCAKNGIIELLDRDTVGHFTLVNSVNDGMLKHGGRWYGRLVGFGDLGRCTPEEVYATIPAGYHNRVTVIMDNEAGHSDHVTGDRLVAILRRIAGQ